jgi:outer membrane protein assembly factor BamB
VLLAALTVLLAPVATAEDWPEFRGPTGQGHSSEGNLPLSWTARNIRWKTPVPGRGWSSPSVAGNHVWLTTAIGEGRSLRLLGFDRETGAQAVNVEVFRLSSAGDMHPKNSHASPTPVVEGDRVYVHFGAHGTACVRTSGEIVWKTRFSYQHLHGTGGSPVLYRDLLIVSCDGVDAQFVAAVDKNTGKTRWRRDRPQPGYMAYSTPLAITANGRDQLISTSAYRAVSYDPQSGKELWRVGYADGFSNVPRPVYAHGLVFLNSGFDRPSLLAVRVDGSGDVTRTHIAWRLDRGVAHTSSPVVVGDELYMVSDNGIAICADAKTGRVHWRHRLGGNFSASPVYADGRIYFLNEDGETTALAPGREFRKLATSTLDEQTLASMAVSGGAFFIRTALHLYRIE